ncbi:Uncharacterized protein GBIM_14287 [Gryllus bimaculatus]|nr:Uncharacterized protein GBIM_14287 [Gryllus bimaculatus]
MQESGALCHVQTPCLPSNPPSFRHPSCSDSRPPHPTTTPYPPPPCPAQPLNRHVATPTTTTTATAIAVSLPLQNDRCAERKICDRRHRQRRHHPTAAASEIDADALAQDSADATPSRSCPFSRPAGTSENDAKKGWRQWYSFIASLNTAVFEIRESGKVDSGPEANCFGKEVHADYDTWYNASVEFLWSTAKMQRVEVWPSAWRGAEPGSAGRLPARAARVEPSGAAYGVGQEAVVMVEADAGCVPSTKAELLELYAREAAFVFHRWLCPHCQRFPGLLRWLRVSAGAPLSPPPPPRATPSRRARLPPPAAAAPARRHRARCTDAVTPSVLAARRAARPTTAGSPIFVGNRRRPAVQRGAHDKMTQAAEMCLRGYRFVVLDGAFLVHVPGVKRREAPSELKARAAHERANAQAYARIARRLAQRYPPAPRASLLRV